MAVAIANQWSGTFSQPAAFGLTPPALQSTVIALSPATSVGGGSGTPTAGNWLFCLTGWNQNSIHAATHAVTDDVRSFWRAGNVTTSTYAVSAASGLSRVSVWYTANLARAPLDVYVAPSGAVDGRACLVIEVSGLGPWDTVTGISTNYAAAATSLSLSLGAPASQSLIIGAVCGDLTGAGQAFAPASWTALSTVSASNGTNHVADAVLTSAYIVTSGSVSVSASATSATDLSGVLIAVATTGTSPIPAGQNPSWPYTKVEAAFGSGYQTAPDQMTWTDLTPRCWSWEEQTGIQFELGQIQATELGLELDNNDGLLSADNPAAYFYTASGANWAPHSAAYDNIVSAGTPLGWWKLNDAAGASTAADSSGNSHSGTATSVTFGNANEAVTGNTSASLASASTSHILTSYNPALSAVTVEAWVNLNGLSQGGNNPRLVANSHTDSDNHGFQLMVTSGGQPQFWVGTGTANGNAAGGTVPATGWTYLAGTWDGTTVRLYVNGVLALASPFSGTLAAGSATGIGLGYNPAYNGDYLNGLLAECAVYGTALTATQIAARYTAGPGATGTPLRMRAAIGTLGGVTQNRWYLIQRNAHQWPQQITRDYRHWSPVTGTDIWASTSAYGTTPYRGEVLQDSPYAWWPCDDQPGSGGVLPSSLRNAAPGNSNALSIVLSPNGATAQLVYSTSGVAPVTNNTASPPPLIAQYTVGQQSGWMYGDPQSSPFGTSAAGGVVTAQPGSSAWTQTGCAGNTGSQAFFLSVNDASFPPLSGGITVEGWFNFPFFGTSSGQNATIYAGSGGDQSGQPVTALTIIELATASAAVCVLQLDSSGHLNFITYAGATPTSNSIYSTADLRTGNWHHFAITLTTAAWTVYVDGGQTATVSGSGATMTSAWTYLLGAGDTGTAGGTGTASIAHSGNVSLAHLAVYPTQLPAYRVNAHYWAAITAFGLLPAPQGVTAQMIANGSGSVANTNAPDGSIFQGTYTGSASSTVATFSSIVTANAGSYSSGPSAWATATVIGERVFAWVGWTTGLAPLFTVYTAASHGSETGASTTISSGESYTAGYGNTATGTGRGHVGAGSGASPPSAPTSTGDTVAQRLERIIGYAGTAGLGYGGVISPCRAIDPAALPVQAATDIGGQQAGQNLQNIAQSDGGWLFIDNAGFITYWQKSHLAAQYSSPAWVLTPDAPPTAGASATAIPYDRNLKWSGDPQRVWNSITITPFSPDGASLPLIIPADTTTAVASQEQYGAQPLQITSYLQSSTEMASQANWLLANYGQLQIRVEELEVDAAPNPALWAFVLGANIGDLVSVQNWAIGNTGVTGVFRISSIRRDIRFAGQDEEVRAALTIQADFEPPSWWS